ncbi:uncharacterized protein LOC131235713 isoform X2 [Magnolia sinica]|uniref:uncharacterized protein LOC131235713 isoform X2 n=1 Tax=Magnolia sinica TaxID=86752 RepID=UPI00265A8622|nr:uncharacterized protein LOC131235713 isoform X2 [Magnolia sinica]
MAFQGTAPTQGDQPNRAFEGMALFNGDQPNMASQGMIPPQGGLLNMAFQGMATFQGMAPHQGNLPNMAFQVMATFQGMASPQGILPHMAFQGMAPPQGYQPNIAFQGMTAPQGDQPNTSIQGMPPPQGDQPNMAFQGTAPLQGGQPNMAFQGMIPPQGNLQSMALPRGVQPNMAFQGMAPPQGNLPNMAFQGMTHTQVAQPNMTFQGMSPPLGNLPHMSFQGMAPPQGGPPNMSFQGMTPTVGDQPNQGMPPPQGGQLMAVMPEEDLRKIIKDIFSFIMNGRWDEVVNIYKEKPPIQEAKITNSEDTILHIAVNDDRMDIVEKLVAEVTDVKILEIVNNIGNTALHLAATMGKVGMCKCMVEKHPPLVAKCNEGGETPLFRAVVHGKKYAFLYLHSKCPPFHGSEYWTRNDGNNILHMAITAEYFDLAYQIIKRYNKNENQDWDLVNILNGNGLSALHFLASKPSAFRSGSHLGRLERLIYDCIVVDRLEETPPDSILNDESQSKHIIEWPENYATCMQFCALLRRLFHLPSRVAAWLCSWASWQTPPNQRDEENPHGSRSEPTDGGGSRSRSNQSEEGRRNNREHPFPPIYTMCYDFFHLALVVLQVLGFIRTYKIKEEKQKHTWAVQIMEELVSQASWWEYNAVQLKRYKESPFLMAARMGVVEMVKHILHEIPVAIRDVDMNGRNALHSAADNRRYKVFIFISKRYFLDYLVRHFDHMGDTPLHLAASIGKSQPWATPSAVLQMQIELKWYKIISESMPAELLTFHNGKLQTPKQVFTETHKDMMKEGAAQLTSMSNSCSVVAALVATVAFATAATIPGGFTSENGTPVFEGKNAFDVFTVSSLIALCFSIISVITFLAILNYPYQESDFGNYLPKKLIIGFTSLLLSIAFMFASFCASHFFLLRDKLHYIAYPVYVTICFSITLFAIFQFPLYFDIIKFTVTSALPDY